MSFSAPDSAPPHPQPAPVGGMPLQGHPYPGGPFPVARPVPGDVLRSPNGLAAALTWLLGAATAVHLFSAGAGAYEQSWLRGFPGGTHFDDLDLGLSPVLTMLAGALQLLTMLPAVIVFVIWFHRVRSNGGIFRPDAFTLRRGWAIGAWFVPVANLFLPRRIALETWRASTQRGPDGSERTASAALLTAWWVVWVLTAITGRVFSRIYMAAETVDELLAAGLLGIAADLGTVTAGVLAVLFVRRLTAMQNTMAAQGPYATA